MYICNTFTSIYLINYLGNVYTIANNKGVYGDLKGNIPLVLLIKWRDIFSKESEIVSFD